MVNFIQNQRTATEQMKVKYYRLNIGVLLSSIMILLPMKTVKKYFLTNIHSVHYLYPRQRKEFYKILNRNIQEAFKDEGWNAYSSAWKLTLADVESFSYELQHINYKQLNQNVQDKLISSKDLQIIENVLREQFISMFISIKDNRVS